jgi:2-polyprenyl-3-methyl-5-hydroxy-6-metoxy-1,4-benzoquinol methylase
MSNIPQQSLYPEDRRVEVLPFIPKSALRALDVGCGRGGFGHTLREALPSGAHVVGMDAVQENVVAARNTGAYDSVSHGFFPEDVPAVAGGYDLIAFLDVLEHMLDPWGALTSSRDVLAPGGKVVAAIPSIQVWTLIRSLVRGRWDYTETGTLDRTHVRFFTKATMVEMFEGSGFAVESCQGINSQKTPLRPVRGVLNRRAHVDMKWLPYVLPDSAWLQFVVVARKA